MKTFAKVDIGLAGQTRLMKFGDRKTTPVCMQGVPSLHDCTCMIAFGDALFTVCSYYFQLLFGLGLPLLLLLDAKQPARATSDPPSLRLLEIILQYITFHSVKVS